jgi:hypothetical protein
MMVLSFWNSDCPVWPCPYWVAIWVVTLFGAALGGAIGGYNRARKGGTGTRA